MAATQPSFDRLASGFSIVSEGIAKLPHVPVINEGRAILEAINTLSESMNNRFNTLQDRINVLQTEVRTLQTNMNDRFNVVTARLDHLELQNRVESVLSDKV